MAVKKSAGKAKSQDESAPKAGAKKSAAKAETAPKKKAATTTTTAAAASAPKKAAGKKAAAAPIKLSSSQSDLLQKIGGTGDPGYRSEKKAEQRTLDALQNHKLIKKGAKHKESGSFHYLISSAGKKHLGSQPSGGSSSGNPTTS